MEFVSIFPKEGWLVIGDVFRAGMESFYADGFQLFVKAPGGFLAVVFHAEFLRKLFHLGGGQDLLSVLVIEFLINVAELTPFCLCAF